MAKTELFARWYSGRISPVYDERQSPGAIMFVNSNTGTDAVGYGGNPATPVATLAYALAAAVTGTGGLIICMPGHAETYATAASLVITKANVTVLGVGNGNQRPTFTFNGGGVIPGVDIDINADNVTFKNLWFVNTEDAATGPIDVNAAGFTMENCIFQDDGADNTVNWIVLDANADYCLIKDCVNMGTVTAGNTAWVSAGACDHLRIINCHSNGDFANANIHFTAAATDVRIQGNLLGNVNAAADRNILGFANTTGWCVYNSLSMVASDTEVTWIETPGGLSGYENFGVNDAGEAGKLVIMAGVSTA